MGAFLGITMLAGSTVLYGLAGQTSYPRLAAGLVGAPRGPLAVGLVAVLAGLFFKTGAVPAQFWVPDVADGTSAPAAAYVTTIPKIGGIAALFRLMDGPLQHVDVDWRLLIAIIAATSMTLGNFAAFFQDACSGTPRSARSVICCCLSWSPGCPVAGRDWLPRCCCACSDWSGHRRWRSSSAS